MELGTSTVDRAEDEITETGMEDAADDGSDDALSAVAVEPLPPPTPPPAPPPHAGPKQTKKRHQKPVIDLDDHIRKAQEAIKMARKQVQQARVQAKLEKRKKQRLVRKASSLNIEDLERIAVLKRCGLASASAASSGSAPAVSSAVAAQPESASNRQERVLP